MGPVDPEALIRFPPQFNPERAYHHPEKPVTKGYYHLMVSDEEIRALARLVLRNKMLLDAAFMMLSDFTQLIEPTLKCCMNPGCKIPATVRHVDAGVQMCDYHAAESMVNAQITNSHASVDHVGDEERWIDLPNAQAIRHLLEYAYAIRKDEEVEAPIDPTEYH